MALTVVRALVPNGVVLDSGRFVHEAFGEVLDPPGEQLTVLCARPELGECGFDLIGEHLYD